MCNFGDAVKLQDALDLLITDWAKEWQLSLSVNKCNILSIRKCPDNALYYINGIELPCLSQYRDLGVVITSELSPSLHTQHITATAHQRANSILRCFVSGDVKQLVRVFIVYVRSLLEYNSVIWSPRLIQDIMKTEKVERHFTKRLRGLKHLSYSDHLNKLGIPSLDLRRLHFDLVYCYKIVFGLVKLNFSDYFDFSVAPTRGSVQTV